MSIFKTNRDFDSTLIVVGIHALLIGIIVAEALGVEGTNFGSLLTNLVVVYGMICSYFFKSQKESNGKAQDTLPKGD